MQGKLNHRLLWLTQTCQPLIKENLDTHEKISGDATKNSEILLFSRLKLNKPCFHWGQSLSVFSKSLPEFPGFERNPCIE